MLYLFVNNITFDSLIGQGSMDHQRDFDHSLEVNEKPVPRPR